MSDPFISKVISLADGENAVIPNAFSEMHKKGIRESLLFLGNREFMEARETGATSKFEFSKKTKKQLEMAISTHLPDVEEDAQKYAKELIGDYQWIIQNAGLLKRVSRFLNSDTPSTPTDATESLAQFIEDRSQEQN